MKVSHRATGGWHRAAFTAAIVVLLAACSGTDDGNSGPAVGPGPPVTTISCPDCPAANVLNVIDGDTFDSSIGRVRFYGIDTPERGEPCFKDATEAARRLLGSVVRLEDGPRRTDSFGRRLAYVYDASGNSVDVQMVADGYAKAWTRDGQHRDALVALEVSAESNGAGCLWGG